MISDAAERTALGDGVDRQRGPGPRAHHFLWFFLALTIACSVHNRLGTVHHDVLEVAMWANAPWTAGFWKHPPLLPWLFKALHVVLPYGPEFLALLMAANIAIGAWATWRIATLALEPERSALAFWLYLLLPYTTIMPLKLNHNAILVSLWPLTILAFLAALRRPTVLAGVLLGLAAALTMLAKYISGLLLLAIFVASIASTERRRFWTSPAPYVAFAAFVIAMTPHILWFIDQAGSPVRYAVSSEKGSSLRALMFPVETLGLIVPIVAATLMLGHWMRRHGTQSQPPSPVLTRELILLTALPWGLTILLTAALKLRGATAWAMPMFSLVPVLLAGTLPSVTATVRRRVAPPVLLIGLIGLVALALAPIAGLALKSPSEIDPREELIREAGLRWRALTASPVRLVMGDTRLVSAATWGLADGPVGWPDVDLAKAPWIDVGSIARTGAIVLCRQHDETCLARARAALDAHAGALAVSDHLISVQRKVGPISGPILAFRMLAAVPAK